VLQEIGSAVEPRWERGRHSWGQPYYELDHSEILIHRELLKLLTDYAFLQVSNS
jgi:hypothetical protein